MTKRYALVEIKGCPSSTIEAECIMKNVCKISKDCFNCRYGDTKEQLVKKVAQILRINLSDTFKNTLHISYKELAKEIVEFLGVEE